MAMKLNTSHTQLEGMWQENSSPVPSLKRNLQSKAGRWQEPPQGCPRHRHHLAIAIRASFDFNGSGPALFFLGSLLTSEQLRDLLFSRLPPPRSARSRPRSAPAQAAGIAPFPLPLPPGFVLHGKEETFLQLLRITSFLQYFFPCSEQKNGIKKLQFHRSALQTPTYSGRTKEKMELAPAHAAGCPEVDAQKGYRGYSPVRNLALLRLKFLY